MVKCLFALCLVNVGVWNCSAWEATRVDTVETRYEDGQLKEQYQQVWWGGNDTTQKTGFYRSWHHNGQLEWEGCYDHDMRINTWVRWDSVGRRVEEVSYFEGVKHGSEIEWNPNGTVKKWLRYKDGKLHGRCVRLTSNYDVNVLYNNPHLGLEADQFYVEGVLVAPLEHVSFEKGGLPGCGLRQAYHNPELDLWIEQPSRTREYYVGKIVEGNKEGLWTLWAEDGIMIRQDRYVDGKSD